MYSEQPNVSGVASGSDAPASGGRRLDVLTGKHDDAQEKTSSEDDYVRVSWRFPGHAF